MVFLEGLPAINAAPYKAVTAVHWKKYLRGTVDKLQALTGVKDPQLPAVRYATLSRTERIDFWDGWLRARRNAWFNSTGAAGFADLLAEAHGMYATPDDLPTGIEQRDLRFVFSPIPKISWALCKSQYRGFPTNWVTPHAEQYSLQACFKTDLGITERRSFQPYGGWEQFHVKFEFQT